MAKQIKRGNETLRCAVRACIQSCSIMTGGRLLQVLVHADDALHGLLAALLGVVVVADVRAHADGDLDGGVGPGGHVNRDTAKRVTRP